MVICATCGRDNPQEARYCMSCAAPLAGPALGQARKTVTIVFCDVVGFTPLGDELDPETVRGVMVRFFEEMRGVLERHGGRVEKYIGDAVMAVFGAPRLHEDDALRAIRAADDMRNALTSLNEDLERTIGVSLATRTGVSTGEVFVSDTADGPSVVGNAVNVAARLQQVASPGDILIERETYELVRGSVEVDEASSLVLKGKRMPVTAYRLLAATGVGETARRAEPALVGRVRELRTLRSAYDDVVDDRACRLVTVLGGAGAGKSRLAKEFVSSLDGDAVAVTGRCLPYGEGITFWPVAEAVRELASIDVDDPLTIARSKLGTLLSGADDSELLFDRVAAAAGLAETTAGMQETFWALRRLLEEVSRQRPLVLILDDLQWAETALLDLLDYLVRSCRDAPLLLLGLGRGDLLDDRSDWIARVPDIGMVQLPPLTDRETTGLIDDLLHGEEMVAGLKERIAEIGGGNPLFVVEMFQMLRDDGLVGSANGPSAVHQGEAASATIPPTIQALVAARLDRLEDDERAVIHGAAVVGKVFSWSSVLELVPAELRPRVGPVLQRLVRRELVAPARSALGEEDAFEFHHLLIQEAAYRETPKGTRADLHTRFADRIEHTSGDRIAENEEILAYHREQAARYRIDLGRRDELTRRSIDRASEALTSVGRRALARGDVSAATNLLGRAYDLLPADDPRRHRLVPELGWVLTESGELSRAEELLTATVAWARSVDDLGLEAHAMIVLLLVKEFTDPEHRSEQAFAALDRVIPILEELGDDVGLARAYRLRGDVYWTQAQYAKADEALERSIEHARGADAEYEEAESLRLYAGSGLYGPAPVEEVIRRCDEIIAAAKGNPTAEAGAFRSLGVLRAMQGDLDEGRRLIRRGMDVMDEHGLMMRATFSSEAAAFIETLAGNHAEAERVLRAGHEEVARVGDLGYQATAAALVAQAICAQGRFEEAAEFSRIAREIGAEDDLATQVLWRSAEAKILASRHASADAADLAREAVALADQTDDINMIADALMDLAEVLSVVGESAETVEARRRAHDLYRRKGNVVAAARAAQLVESRPPISR